MVKREKMKGIQICREVFKTTDKWITAKELCDIAKKKVISSIITLKLKMKLRESKLYTICGSSKRRW